MARPVYPYELNDPDFLWLIDQFRENHPEYRLVESDLLPLVFLQDRVGLERSFLPLLAESRKAREPAGIAAEEEGEL